ncbi:CMRF35-like molecule 1 isoform X2 [Manis javanica]|uniref:CMRF35-like molecule 1 isoform X2 n=1 Tax=Manis javanica TaxID=9974 RepID=UPI003C6D7920
MKTLDCIRISDKAEVQSENKKDGNCQINFRKLAWLSCQTLTRQQRETPRKAPSGSGASSVIRGPGAVRGPVGGSLTVQCHYDPGWEKYVKWWCRGAAWSSCNILVKTTGSEHKVKMNHVSIEDDQMNRMFTVTLEELRWSDADTYWCGIEKIAGDLGVQVKVAVDPAPTTEAATTPTSTTTTMFTVPVTPEETLHSPNMTSHHPDGSDSLQLSVLLPVVSTVLLLLLVAASFLAWRLVKRQKKAAGTSPEQPLEGDLCYANLTPQQPGTSSEKKASKKPPAFAQASQEEVEYVTMAPFPKEDISYAALYLHTLDQDPTYSNTGCLITHTSGRGHEEPSQYSAIRKS